MITALRNSLLFQSPLSHLSIVQSTSERTEPLSIYWKYLLVRLVRLAIQ